MERHESSDAGSLLRSLRAEVNLSQRNLAARAGTSGPTIAAYENGHKRPRCDTLAHLVAAANHKLTYCAIPTESSLSRDARRNLALHSAIAGEIRNAPNRLLPIVQENIDNLIGLHRDSPAIVRNLHVWRWLIDGPVDRLLYVLADDTSCTACNLRQNTPFARILSNRQRWDVLRNFRAQEGQAHAS